MKNGDCYGIAVMKHFGKHAAASFDTITAQLFRIEFKYGGFVNESFSN